MNLAYLDPQSGSMIASALVAGAAGAAVVGKAGLKRITSPFRKKGKAEETVETAEPEQPVDH
jgi:hypothetical protein